MVSLAGAQNAKPLVDTILSLQSLIAKLQAQASPGPVVVWKISVDAYIGASAASQTLTVLHTFTPAHSGSIGSAILTVLQAELATAQAQLTAIT